MRKHISVFAAALALATACSSNEASKTGGSGNGSAGGTFIVSTVGDVVEPFPPFVSDVNGAMLVDLVFDRLAMIGPKLATVGDKDFQPQLAKSWTWSPDSLSIAFHLDPKARWHDGKPVTASDVRYSFNVFKDPKTASPAGSLLDNIDSVSAPDSLTAVVWYKRHLPEEFYNFVYQIVVMPQHVYGSIPDDQLHTSPQTRQLVGSGQYRFVKWQPRVRLDLVADTANYRGRPMLDRIVMTPITDANAGVAAILTGQSDFLQAFPVDQVDKLDSSKVARRLDIPTQAYAWLGFNPVPRKAKSGVNPIFGDVRVRRALSMAIDRQAMLKNVFGSVGHIGYGPFPAVMTYADSNLKLLPYDTAAAKALLDSSGWRMGANGVRAKNGVPLKFSITVPTSSLFRRQYAVLIQEAFKRIGAQTDIDVVDPPTFQHERLEGGDFDAIIGTFQPDQDVGGSRQTWGTSAIGSTNWLRYSNKKVDALLDSAVVSFDPAKSRSYSSRAFQQIVDDAPAVWLYDVTLTTGINRRIQPATPFRADGWWRNLGQWSIPADKRIDRDRIGVGQSTP